MDRNDSGIPHNLTADDLANLRTYIAADNPSDAWRYLAEHGDAYGVLASRMNRKPWSEKPSTAWLASIREIP